MLLYILLEVSGRGIDLNEPNFWGALFVNCWYILMGLCLLLAFLYFLFKTVLFSLFNHRQRFEYTTTLATCEDYLDQYLSAEAVSDNATFGVYPINAWNTMERLEKHKCVIKVNAGTEYIIRSYNVFSKFKKIQLIEDGQIYYAKI